jgi:hypothetical protein
MSIPSEEITRISKRQKERVHWEELSAAHPELLFIPV